MTQLQISFFTKLVEEVLPCNGYVVPWEKKEDLSYPQGKVRQTKEDAQNYLEDKTDNFFMNNFPRLFTQRQDKEACLR